MALPYYTRLEIDALLENFQPSGGDTTVPEPGEGGEVFYFDNYDQFPRPGEANNLYVDNSDGLIYIWDNSITDYKAEGRTQVQSDWNEPDSSSVAYIRNRPNANESFRPFITKWTVTAGETVTLPLSNTANYDFQVDWGDGTPFQQINSGDSEFKSHTYTDAGEYNISIKGILDYFMFESGNTSSITEIVQWGDIVWKEISFRDCSNLTALPTIDYPNLLQVSSLFFSFANCSLSSIPSDIFVLSTNITDFRFVFRGNSITSIPEGLFDSALSAVRFDSAFKVNLITSIPNGLFKGCINAKSFREIFRDNNIEILPEDTFSSCILVEDFSGVFYDNNISNIPLNIFKYNKRITDLTEGFRYNNVTTALPELWLDFPDIPAGNCFDAIGTPTNQADIPDTWGGTYVGGYPQEIEEMRAYWHTTLQKPVWKRDDGQFVDATGAVV